MPFTKLGLSDPLTRALATHHFSDPTPIQQAVIPAVINGSDVMGIAKTGSGKTASYLLPILQRLQVSPPSEHRAPQILILVPTRELADQVQQVAYEFSSTLPQRTRSLAVYGGTSIQTQMQTLGSVDILIATPGRLLDLLLKNALTLAAITTFVMDEADKLLNLGFKQEVDDILRQLPKKRQNLLFSATLSSDLTSIQNGLLSQPVIHHLSEDSSDAPLINQLGYFCTEARKGPLLRYLIKHDQRKQVLVFANSSTKVDSIVNKLSKNKISCIAMHSKMSQGARRDALRQFKEGSLTVLVATDLLARGIDIEFLPCVINYELPRSPKDYTHRIGRTGRAQSPGEAITLITMDELPHFRVIQKKTGNQVPMLHSDEINLHGY